jgi:hypothetical protein
MIIWAILNKGSQIELATHQQIFNIKITNIIKFALKLKIAKQKIFTHTLGK